MEYDIIIITGEKYFDHPLCGAAIIKKLLEKKGYSTGIIDMPQDKQDIAKLGKPKLFFGVSSGSIDSMLQNYTPLKKKRETASIPDRAVIIYCNWIRNMFKETKIVIGGTEASLRRFTHYDYWDNKLRKPLLFDSRADILVFGNGEKQIIEIADKIKKGKELSGIQGTCIISNNVPEGFKTIPSFESVSNSKEEFCKMQNLLSNESNLAQETNGKYILQFSYPEYTTEDLDSYYEMQFERQMPKHLRGFEFSIVSHRGCIGECSFCALKLMQGKKIISRSEKSILKEIELITKQNFFKGNIDDLGGPSANMYGMDCRKCNGTCIDCKQLDKTNSKLIQLLKKARNIKGVKNVFIKSGIRYDIASPEYVNELAKHHIFDTLRIAPEHVNKKVLELMNKNKGDLKKFIKDFEKTGKKLSYYFMTAHPGSEMKEAEELAKFIKNLANTERVQVFTPTPMTTSTCMYYTGLNPKTLEKVYIPYTYLEKKKQKRVLMKK